jgi:hypothetical protein
VSSDRAETTIPVDLDENTFKIVKDNVVLANCGFQILCGKNKYTTVKSEIVPVEKLKGKPPTIFLLTFQSIPSTSKTSQKDWSIEKYSLKSDDGVIDAIITFQNYKKLDQVNIRVDFVKEIDNISTGSYNKPCLEFFYTNESNLSNALTYSDSIPPSSQFSFDFTTAPVMLFNDDLDTLMIGGTENPHLFIAYTEKNSPTKHHFGVEGLLEKIPEGFAFELMLIHGKGIVNSWLQFGERYMIIHGRTQRTPQYGSVSQDYLGYSVMTGSTYYERSAEGLDMMQTLLMVKEEANLLEIPYLYYSLGSWFYPKNNGLIEWRAMENIFPGGMTALQEILQSGLVCAISWFSEGNIYRPLSENWIEGSIIKKKKEIKCLLPFDTAVWENVFQISRSWNCFILQFEELDEIWEIFPILKKEPYLFKDFLKIIADLCEKYKYKIIISKVPSAMLPVFASFNCFIQAVNSDEGYESCLKCSGKLPDRLSSSLMFWSYGFWPSKSTVFSMPYRGTHELPPEKTRGFQLDVLISALSGSMIALGDAIGSQNSKIILQTCRDDGLLFKPERPLLPIDLMFIPNNKPYVCSTYSVNGGKQWHYVLSVLTDDNKNIERFITLQDLGIASGKWVYFDYFDKLVMSIDAETKLCGYGNYNGLNKYMDHHYAVIAPLYSNGVALIGLRDKYITAPSTVFQSIKETKESFVVKGKYSKNKDFTLLFYSEKKPVTVTFNGTPIIVKWGEFYKTMALTMWLTDSEDFTVEIKL